MTRPICILSAVFLTGCATTNAPPPTIYASCPAPVDYTIQFEQQFAADASNLPPNGTVARMLDDYRRERAILKACAKS